MEIFIACPYNTVTGGVELLHQLCYELNKYDNVKAYIWYPMIKNPNNDNICHPDAYTKYYCPKAIKEPDKDTILIFPEIWAKNVLADIYRDNIKFIYWESVDNYLAHTESSKKFLFADNTYHIVQSYYALDFLINQVKINRENIIEVTDYLNDIYFEEYEEKPRKNQVVYNPAKGYEFAKYIIEYMKDTNFVPIQDMTSEEVRDLLRSSALYIDFGNFPGKDRIPREACISGCCIITSKDGAAKYTQDVDIPNIYKFDKNKSNVPLICSRIKYILEHYEECNKDFEEYRNDICKEKGFFEVGVTILVAKIESLLEK